MSAARAQRVACTLLLLAGFAVIALLTLELGPMARRVPIVVVFPTVALLAVQLVFDLLPVASRRPPAPAGALFRMRGAPDRARAVLAASSEADDRDPRTEVSTLAWLLALPALVALAGVAVAAPAYALVYLRVRARAPWLISLGTAGAMGVLASGAKHMAPAIPAGPLWTWMGVG
jgi:hypothetical protein